MDFNWRRCASLCANRLVAEREEREADAELESRVWMTRYYATLFKLLVVLHTPVVACCVQSMQCVKREDGVARSVILPAELCGTSDHAVAVELAAAILAVVGFGMPAFFALCLYLCSREMFGLSLDDDTFRRVYGPLFTHLQRGSVFWECWSLAFRAIFACAVLALQDEAQVAQHAAVLCLPVGF